MIRQFYRVLRATIFHYLIPQSRQPIFASGKRGVEVVGFFHSASGIAESARLCAKQLQENGIPVRCVSVEPFFRKQGNMVWDFKDTATEEEIGCRIIHLNPPMIPPYALLGGIKKFASVYNVGYWAWELEQLPPEWVRATRYMNAIMTPSEFSSNAIRKATSKPVLTVPHPVTKGEASAGMRQKLGLDQSHFVISMIFSYESSIERKNPHAAIRAFKLAFPDSPDVRLVLKTSKGGDDAIRSEIQQIIDNDVRILVVEQMWDKEDINALIAESNVYLSLHRSEGFGLTLAEAMLLDTVVVATDWSGNIDFCTEQNSFPVPYNLVGVQSGHAAFEGLEGSQWAEADVSKAAAILRDIHANPAQARQKAEYCLAVSNQYFKEPRYVAALKELSA